MRGRNINALIRLEKPLASRPPAGPGLTQAQNVLHVEQTLLFRREISCDYKETGSRLNERAA
jgi:hypothetical protein